jgi:2-oxoglutarate ferredoxin oxidoreductase subunit delta
MGSKDVLVINGEMCKGCGYCIEYCPKKALYASDEINALGYAYVHSEAGKCVACGVCFNVCPDYVFEILQEADSCAN